jgi:hypothetical protein
MFSLDGGGDGVEEDTALMLFRSSFMFYNVNFDVSFDTRRLHELASNLLRRFATPSPSDAYEIAVKVSNQNRSTHQSRDEGRNSHGLLC